MQGSPMLKEYGVNSTFLENPFYGFRKPKDQLRSSVHYVNDIFVMGAALILESWVVLNWLKKNGLGSVFCLTGPHYKMVPVEGRKIVPSKLIR